MTGTLFASACSLCLAVTPSLFSRLCSATSSCSEAQEAFWTDISNCVLDESLSCWGVCWYSLCSVPNLSTLTVSFHPTVPKLSAIVLVIRFV
ncbi:Uncharacterized protein DAT39_019221 [Clarias magur]|uniref:Secreted protein n=1 Tax=Clarias magur TaxID=1594786 RepID=A0A8J4WU56_CLAMG|nr:Uncharacterized protein DAT39_019221 [Clarias magur]